MDFSFKIKGSIVIASDAAAEAFALDVRDRIRDVVNDLSNDPRIGNVSLTADFGDGSKKIISVEEPEVDDKPAIHEVVGEDKPKPKAKPKAKAKTGTVSTYKDGTTKV